MFRNQKKKRLIVDYLKYTKVNVIIVLTNHVVINDNGKRIFTHIASITPLVRIAVFH